MDRLSKTFNMPILSQDDKNIQNETQALLCGVLQTATLKLKDKIMPAADKLMELYLTVFSAKSASVHEEALMAVGALATVAGAEFAKYMPPFRYFLLLGLRNYEEYQVCAVAVGVVGDICRAIERGIVPYCDELITILLEDLRSLQLHRSVKPPILSCFADIALAIGGEFVKYLGVVIPMLQQASATQVDTSDDELVDYLNELREGIFEAYTGIIQGLHADKQAEHFLPCANAVVAFVNHVYQDHTRSEAVTHAAVGVLGDMGQSLGAKAKQQLSLPFVSALLAECAQSDDDSLRDDAKWAEGIIAKL